MYNCKRSGKIVLYRNVNIVLFRILYLHCYILYIFVAMNEVDKKDSLESIAERMFEFVASQGISSAEFASILDIGSARLSHIKNGRNNISLEICSKILVNFPNLNPDWLLLGQGNMLRQSGGQSPAVATSAPKNLFSKTEPEAKNETPRSGQPQIEHIIPQINGGRKVEKIILYYDDKSYEEFLP